MGKPSVNRNKHGNRSSFSYEDDDGRRRQEIIDGNKDNHALDLITSNLVGSGGLTDSTIQNASDSNTIQTFSNESQQSWRAISLQSSDNDYKMVEKAFFQTMNQSTDQIIQVCKSKLALVIS